MYQLLVVDDEPKTRWRVQHMVRQLDVAWDSIAADDGTRALELLDGVDADLVLTDVRMPTMDGLAFIEELRTRGNNALVVMLSAYTDFAYAKQAMRLGALDYLAKPLDPTELRAVLLRAGQILDLASPASRDENAGVRNIGEDDREAARGRLMADLLEGHVTIQDWRARAQVLGLAALTARVSTMSYPQAAHEAVAQWLQEVRRRIARDESLVIIPWGHEHISAIRCSHPAHGQGASTGWVVPSAGTADAPPQRCPVPGVRVGTGRTYPIAEARTSYLESLEVLRRLQETDSKPIDAGAGHPHPSAASTVSVGAQQAVQRACAWIEAHYARPLTLGDVAHEVYFHPKYLCAVFPLVTGHSFGAYLIHTRIEKAKTLLLETHLPCHAIAEHVGYHSERCFAQAFRRHVGLTPTEYRHTHMPAQGRRAERLTLSD